MPRIGMNPSRGKTLDFIPARVTVCVLTYLPHQAGFFQHRMDVVRMTIESVIANTKIPYNLLILDNGSSKEMVDYLIDLYEKGHIDYLLLSKNNIGKLNALRAMFQAAPGEVIAYADDDIYHLPGWLQAHLDVLDAFPNVGAVTGFYVRERVRLSSASTVAWAGESNHKVKQGLLMPKKWEEEYIEAYDRSPERYFQETNGIEDIIVQSNGLEAWVSAHHFQVVLPRKVILPIIDEMIPNGWNNGLMGRMVEMDDLMDAKGYLRLTTREQTIKLMGNAITEEIAQVAKSHGLEVEQAKISTIRSGFLRKITSSSIVRRIMQRIVNKLHTLLNMK
ncbi:MAG: glycosyltransferase family 2 protein [Anaerolineaceae bacterium]|nr:glycosyltransferase family 2 protein [Anaerolineaceae bacterium]